MRFIKQILTVLLFAVMASCQKSTNTVENLSPESLTATGVLYQQGPTTYMYGTHILYVNSNTQYVLESTTLNLNAFLGRNVKITAFNTHYQAENGPAMYNVTSIATAP